MWPTQAHQAQLVGDRSHQPPIQSRKAALCIKDAGGIFNAFDQPAEIILREPLWRDDMGELERGEQAEAKSDIAGTGRQIVVSARQERVSCSIEQHRSFATVVQFDIAIRHGATNAETGASRHRVRQPGQVRPDVAVELPDAQTAPVTTRPFRRRRFKLRPALSAPGAQERFFFRNARCRRKEIGVEHVVVVHEDEQVALCFADTTEPCRRETERVLAEETCGRLPGHVGVTRNRLVAAVVHHDQLPPVARQRLLPQRVEATPKISRPRIVSTKNDADDHGMIRCHELKARLSKNLEPALRLAVAAAHAVMRTRFSLGTANKSVMAGNL
jgi:hypothetical protein